MAKTKAPPTFAETLLRGMSDTGMTDDILARKIGYDPDTIYRWRTGKAKASRRAQKACLQAITRKR